MSNKASIYINKGMLIINFNDTKGFKLHENVLIERKDGEVIVTADKCHFAASMSRGTFNLKEITEDSKEYYNPWPWSREKKARSKYVVQFLKRTPVSYMSNNYVIIT